MHLIGQIKVWFSFSFKWLPGFEFSIKSSLSRLIWLPKQTPWKRDWIFLVFHATPNLHLSFEKLVRFFIKIIIFWERQTKSHCISIFKQPLWYYENNIFLLKILIILLPTFLEKAAETYLKKIHFVSQLKSVAFSSPMRSSHIIVPLLYPMGIFDVHCTGNFLPFA